MCRVTALKVSLYVIHSAEYIFSWQYDYLFKFENIQLNDNYVCQGNAMGRKYAPSYAATFVNYTCAADISPSPSFNLKQKRQ